MVELGNYELAKLRNFLDIDKEFIKDNFSGHIYIWSDFHLNDPEIIYVSGRDFWKTNSLGVKVPDTESEKEYIIEKLKELEDNSIFLNLGDIGRIESCEDEDSIKEVNKVLRDKNIYNILLLGNHDYLKDNKYYEILEGQEDKFYKSLGFNKVLRNPILLIDKGRDYTYILSHKPIIKEAIENINYNFKHFSLISTNNIHGHWHSYDTDNTYLRKSACIDIIDKPLDIEIKSEDIELKETCLTNKEFFLRDPWL